MKRFVEEEGLELDHPYSRPAEADLPPPEIKDTVLQLCDPGNVQYVCVRVLRSVCVHALLISWHILVNYFFFFSLPSNSLLYYIYKHHPCSFISPLNWAIFAEQTPTAKYLVEKGGANPDGASSDG